VAAKCRFIVINRRVLNHMCNFQAAGETWLLIFGVLCLRHWTLHCLGHRANYMAFTARK